MCVCDVVVLWGLQGLGSINTEGGNEEEQIISVTSSPRYTSHKKFSEGKQVHVGMEASKSNQTRWE